MPTHRVPSSGSSRVVGFDAHSPCAFTREQSGCRVGCPLTECLHQGAVGLSGFMPTHRVPSSGCSRVVGFDAHSPCAFIREQSGCRVGCPLTVRLHQDVVGLSGGMPTHRVPSSGCSRVVGWDAHSPCAFIRV